MFKKIKQPKYVIEIKLFETLELIDTKVVTKKQYHKVCTDLVKLISSRFKTYNTRTRERSFIVYNEKELVGYVVGIREVIK